MSAFTDRLYAQWRGQFGDRVAGRGYDDRRMADVDWTKHGRRLDAGGGAPLVGDTGRHRGAAPGFVYPRAAREQNTVAAPLSNTGANAEGAERG